MTTVSIPAWNTLGVLPPNDPLDPTSPERSPYPVPLLDVVMRFGTTAERRRVLRGFLGYRATLHGLGLIEGFQWLDGSFTEHVELLERRAPRDIDVVTFLTVPDDFNPSDDEAALIEHDAAKTKFLVDSYFVELNILEPWEIVARSAYWYSMWSHRRNQAWKGYLQVDLNPAQDQEAHDWLTQRDAEEVQP